jgi:hypothetical protein
MKINHEETKSAKKSGEKLRALRFFVVDLLSDKASCRLRFLSILKIVAPAGAREDHV